MKRILFVHQVSFIGGASYCLLNLLKEIDREVYEPIVLLKNDGPLVEELNRLNINVDFMPDLTIAPYNMPFWRIYTLKGYCQVLNSKKNFKKALEKLKPDIVYFNNVFLYPYLKVSYELGIKSVIHIREHWPINEHVFQFDWLKKSVQKYADRVVAINTYSAQMIPDITQKTTIVYDWIDLSERYQKHDMKDLIGEKPEGLKIFLYSGGFQKIKGTLEVLEIFSKYKKPNYRLLLLGGDIESIYNDFYGIIKKNLAKIGVKSPGMRMIELMQKDNNIIGVPSTYYIKDILEKSYCMLSFFTIPHANLALAESIIQQLPVIAARTEESEEYSFNGKYAWLFPLGNKEAFANCFCKVEECYESMKVALEQGSKDVATLFDKDINANRFNNVLNSLEKEEC